MDDTPTDSLLAALEGADPGDAPAIADEIVARLNAELSGDESDAGSPQA